MLLIFNIIQFMIHNKENPKAILLILSGMTVFAIQDTLIKLISDTTNIFLIYFVRSLVGLIVIIFYLKIKNKPFIFKTYYPFLTSIRVFCFFIGFSLYYFSLTKLSLALAITLFFVSPFFISIFSMLIIKETIGIHRWLAISVGFLGVYLVMNPQFHDFNIYSLFPVICAVCYSFSVVIQKKTSDKDSLFSQVSHLYISAIIFSFLLKLSLHNVSFSPETIEEFQFVLSDWNIYNLTVLFMLVIIGLTGVIGWLCLFSAYRIGSPPTIAPFEYVIILWAILISWFLWGETLTFRAYVGLLFIISAGIYTFYRETKLNKLISLDKPLR